MKIRRHIRAGDDETKLLNLAINEIITQMSIEGGELTLTEHQRLVDLTKQQIYDTI